MISSSLVFVHHQLNLSSISILLLLLLCLSRLSGAFAADSSRWKRAIGGESLDSSNFVLYEDPATGFKYIEVPYEYMEQWLDDQRMWRTWSIVLAVLSIIFFGTLIVFLIHSYRTMTGPFSLCAKTIDDQPSEDKMGSIDGTAYGRPNNTPLYNTKTVPAPFFPMKPNVS